MATNIMESWNVSERERERTAPTFKMSNYLGKAFLHSNSIT